MREQGFLLAVIVPLLARLFFSLLVVAILSLAMAFVAYALE